MLIIPVTMPCCFIGFISKTVWTLAAVHRLKPPAVGRPLKGDRRHSSDGIHSLAARWVINGFCRFYSAGTPWEFGEIACSGRHFSIVYSPVLQPTPPDLFKTGFF